MAFIGKQVIEFMEPLIPMAPIIKPEITIPTVPAPFAPTPAGVEAAKWYAAKPVGKITPVGQPEPYRRIIPLERPPEQGPLYSPELAALIKAQQTGVPWVPEDPSKFPLYSPEFAKAVQELQAQAIARGKTPSPGALFRFDVDPFRDIAQMPLLPEVPDILGGMKDTLIIAAVALGGLFLVGKYLGGSK